MKNNIIIGVFEIQAKATDAEMVKANINDKC